MDCKKAFNTLSFTLLQIAPNKEVSLSSLLVARVTKIPHIGTPDQATIKTHEIFTKVIPRETGVPPGMVPLWVVVLSAVAGAIILMLLVYLLYKVRLEDNRTDQ
jgi:hypothetical protein